MMARTFGMKKYDSPAAVFLLFWSSLSGMGDVSLFFGDLAFLF